jgi:hypothetical protein
VNLNVIEKKEIQWKSYFTITYTSDIATSQTQIKLSHVQENCISNETSKAICRTVLLLNDLSTRNITICSDSDVIYSFSRMWIWLPMGILPETLEMLPE